MNNYEVRIGKYIKEAWELFMKAPEVFVVSTLVYVVVFFALARIPFIGSLINILWGSMYCVAMYLEAEHVKKEGKGSFDIMKNATVHLPQITVFSIVTGIFFVIGMLFLILPGIYLIVAYSLGTQMVIFKGKNFWEAMEASRILVNKNWFSVFCLSFVNILIILFGFFFFGIGGLVTLPLSYLILFCAFSDITNQAGV